MRRVLLVLALVSMAASRGLAAEEPTPTPAADSDHVRLKEVVVVTASKVEQTLVNAPATLSVLTGDVLAEAPAQNWGDVFRTVPGLNVIQMSARDVNLTGRQATGTLANTQLVLVDGRSVYLDLFGLILWDFVPSNPEDIKQVEVVRGPASAVWGANALTGVINIITKSPREAPGGSLNLNAGVFSRDAGASAGGDMGNSFGGSLTFSQAPNDTWSYRISGGYFDSDDYARPSGTIPVGTNPADPSVATGGADYPDYENRGTKQPKVDVRVDQELSNGGRMSYGGGYAGTQGILHTGIGPFDIDSGSSFSYGKVTYSKGSMRINAFANVLDVEAPNAILRNPETGEPVLGIFKTQTFDLEFGDSKLLGGKHVLTYGGNARRNNFDISIAEDEEDRTEFGLYVQDEVFFDKLRISGGVRVDKFSVIDDPVLSPRVSVLFKPAADHSFRVSFNQAFRSPSVINNSLLVRTVQPVDLSGLAPLLPPPLRPAVAQPFPLVVRVVGNTELREESLTAYELGYTGTFAGRTTVGVALYLNDLDDNVNFVTLPPNFDPYTGANPPPGWRLPASIVDVIAARGIFLPRTVFTYQNLGPLRNRGVEITLEHAFSNKVTAYGNYSWQDEPEPLDDPEPFPATEITDPPTHRYNLGLKFNTGKVFGNAYVNHSDGGFWTDVLTPDFHGGTDAFTTVNASLGVKWNKRVTTSIKALNLTDEDVQQHIFGDIFKRNVTLEARVSF